MKHQHITLRQWDGRTETLVETLCRKYYQDAQRTIEMMRKYEHRYERPTAKIITINALRRRGLMTEQEAKDIGTLIAARAHLKKETPEQLAEGIGTLLVKTVGIGKMSPAVAAWWQGLLPTTRAELLTAIYEAMQDRTPHES